MSASLPKSVHVTIKEKKYEVKVPNTGQFITIQNMKGRLLGSNTSNSALDNYAFIMAEMISTYTVLLPDLRRDLKIESLSELSMFDGKELLDSYVETYRPLFEKWMDVITEKKPVATV